MTDPASIDVGVSSLNSDTAARTSRLRQAVDAAGRNKAVAKRAALSVGTLNNYLRGRDMPTNNLVALADACGVTIEWLATGRGPMRPGEAGSAAPVPPAPTPVSPKLFSIMEMDLMGECLEAAFDQLRRRNPNPSWRRVAQIAALLYDQLKEDKGSPSDPAASQAAPGKVDADPEL